jgi:hypothetical protein
VFRGGGGDAPRAGAHKEVLRDGGDGGRTPACGPQQGRQGHAGTGWRPMRLREEKELQARRSECPEEWHIHKLALARRSPLNCSTVYSPSR